MYYATLYRFGKARDGDEAVKSEFSHTNILVSMFFNNFGSCILLFSTIRASKIHNPTPEAAKEPGQHFLDPMLELFSDHVVLLSAYTCTPIQLPMKCGKFLENYLVIFQNGR